MIDRKHLYSLEFIRSEMEMKLHAAKIKNEFSDYTDAENKIKMLGEAIGHVYQLHENIEKFNNKKNELELWNSKLLAEILHLRSNG